MLREEQRSILSLSTALPEVPWVHTTVRLVPFEDITKLFKLMRIHEALVSLKRCIIRVSQASEDLLHLHRQRPKCNPEDLWCLQPQKALGKLRAFAHSGCRNTSS